MTECRHRVLEFQFQRSALPVSTNEPNGYEWQEEHGGEFAGAECRSPDANERRKSLAHTRGGAPEAADLRIGAYRTHKGNADKRPDGDEHHPEGARSDEFTPLLREEPEPGWPT